MSNVRETLANVQKLIEYIFGWLEQLFAAFKKDEE